MSLAEMRAYAQARGWKVEVERIPAGEGREIVRLWSMLDGRRTMTDKVVPTGDPAVLDELATIFLYWWREDEQRRGD